MGAEEHRRTLLGARARLCPAGVDGVRAHCGRGDRRSSEPPRRPPRSATSGCSSPGRRSPTVGDRLAGIALAFAVLDIGSATALGIVFAVRQGVQALVVVGGGVLSDRLPRNLVLVGASRRAGHRAGGDRRVRARRVGGVGAIVALQAVYGLGLGLVLPAEVGLVPQTVSAGPPPAGERAPGADAERRRRARAGGRRRARRRRQPGDRRSRSTRRASSSARPPRAASASPRATRRGAPGFLARAAGGLAGVHVADVALGVGRALRDREPRLRAGGSSSAPRSRTSASAAPGAWAAILTAGGVGAVARRASSRCGPARAGRSSPACSLAALLSLQTLALALGAPTWADRGGVVRRAASGSPCT